MVLSIGCTFTVSRSILEFFYIIALTFKFFFCKIGPILLHSVSSVAQLCLTLCDPMDCSTPGFPVNYQVLELARTHVHWDGDAIQPSHLNPSPPAFNVSQHQILYQSVFRTRWPKYWTFNFNISPSNEYSGLISFRIDWLTGLISLQSNGLWRVFSNTTILVLH